MDLTKAIQSLTELCITANVEEMLGDGRHERNMVRSYAQALTDLGFNVRICEDESAIYSSFSIDDDVYIVYSVPRYKEVLKGLFLSFNLGQDVNGQIYTMAHRLQKYGYDVGICWKSVEVKESKITVHFAKWDDEVFFGDGDSMEGVVTLQDGTPFKRLDKSNDLFGECEQIRENKKLQVSTNPLIAGFQKILENQAGGHSEGLEGAFKG